MPSPIQRVTVIGAGTMGHGIAQVSAGAGCEVVLHDVDALALDRAMTWVQANLDKGVELGKVEPGEREGTLERLSTSPDLEEACAGADLVVEAVPERLELKEGVLQAAERASAEEAVIATNTSSLSIDALAGPLRRPERFLGLHFFNPVHILRLVEVVRGERTAGSVVEAALGFVRRLGKEPVVVRDSPGFASSRLGVTLGLEAIRMVEEGVAEPEAIDKAMELGYRHPMGPLRLSDLVGLDVRLEIAQYLHDTLGDDRFRPPELLRRMVAEGKLGKKSGEGFYRWEE